MTPSPAVPLSREALAKIIYRAMVFGAAHGDEAFEDAALKRHYLGVADQVLAAFSLTDSGEPVVPHDAISEIELSEWAEKVRNAIFYARVAARSKGYALAVHGTLRRDVDVVAVPWTDEACGADELMEHIVEYLRSVGVCYGGDDTGTLAHAKQSREVKPFGRIAYALPLKGIPAPYLDLSVAPRESPSSSALERAAQEDAQRWRQLTASITKDADIEFCREEDEAGTPFVFSIHYPPLDSFGSPDPRERVFKGTTFNEAFDAYIRALPVSGV